MELALKAVNRAKRARESSFGWLVDMLARRLDEAMRRELAQVGLELGSFATLMTLFEQEGVTQAELSAAVGVPSYATTRRLDKMEKQGLVERHPDPQSRRSHRIVLTKKARGLQRELIAIVGRVNKNALQHLEPSERAQLVSWLQQVELGTRAEQ